MTYFTLDPTGKLKIRSTETTIDDFTQNTNLGTLDIVEYTYNINRKKIDELYNIYCTQEKWTKTSVNQDDKSFGKDSYARRIIDGIPPRDLQEGELLSPSCEIQITKLLSPKPIETREKIIFSFEELDQWKENFRAYSSSLISLQEEEVILKAKSLQEITPSQRQELKRIGPLMTFVSDSRIYLDAKNNILKSPLEIKVFGFATQNLGLISGKQKYNFNKMNFMIPLKKFLKLISKQ